MPLWGSNGSSPSSSSSLDPPPSSSVEIKNTFMKTVQAEAAMSNAKALISKLNENCFKSCVPTPGSSLSSSEDSCISSCMEKYISLWNTVNRTYIGRANREARKLGAGADASAMGSIATGSSSSSSSSSLF